MMYKLIMNANIFLTSKRKNNTTKTKIYLCIFNLQFDMI